MVIKSHVICLEDESSGEVSALKKLFLIFLISLISIALIAEEPEYKVEEYSGGKYGGMLYVGTISGPKTLNPSTAYETSSTDIIGWFLDGLVDFDKNGKIVGGALAKEWEISPDGKSYIFKIRKGLKWSDGHPFTAEDVYFTFKEIWTNKELAGNHYDGLLGPDGNPPSVELIDEYTVKISYNEPFAPGLRYVGSEPILPKHVVEPLVKEGKWLESWTVADVDKIVGMGPFIPVEYTPDVRVVLKRNPNYYRVDKDGNRLPYLDGIVYVIIPDMNTMRLKFEAGDLDVYAPRAQDYPDLKAMAREKGWVVDVDGPTFGTQFFVFNWNALDPIKRKWFRNVHFRRAVAYALDKDTIIETIYNGLGTPQYGPVSAASPFYNPEIEEKYPYPYSLTLAKIELKRGGFSWNEEGKLVDSEGNVVKFTLTTNAGNTVREDMCNIITESLKKLGMDVTFSPIDFNTLVQKLLNTGDWEMVMIGLTGGVDPHGGSNVWKLDGALHFWNYSPERKKYVDPNDYWVPDFEKRIDEIFRLEVGEMDPEKRRALFDEFQELVAENLPLIYTAQRLYMFAYKKILHNVDPAAWGGMLWNGYAIWKEQ